MMNARQAACLSSFIIHHSAFIVSSFILTILSILFRFFFYLNYYRTRAGTPFFAGAGGRSYGTRFVFEPILLY
jgi:hypothetical protein